MAGILVRDLQANGTVEVKRVNILDTFNGIYFEDAAGFMPTGRTATIEDSKIEECGPVNGFLGDKGHAGIRLLESHSVGFDLHVTRCTLNQNHDALEPGEATLTLTDSVFFDNENGLEYAAGTTGGTAAVTGCCFRQNARFDPITEGGVLEPTGGIVVRGAMDVSLTVRATDFDQNQMGVLLKGLSGTFDFGTTFISPGNNTFTTDTTSPWYEFLDHTVSYCGLFAAIDAQVSAVGNTWTYVVGNADFNQGADSSGQFPQSLGPKTIGPGVNFDPTTGDPPHRALDGTSDPQVPWNYSTGPVFLMTGNPKILLVP